MPKARKYSPTQRAAQGAVLHVVDRHAPPVKGKYPPLIGANGEAVTLTMMGADSPTAKRLAMTTRAEQQSRVVARVRSGESDGGVTAEDIAEQEQRDIEKCARLVIAWTGVTEDDGTASPLTPENARALFADDEDIRLQALDFVEDRPSFFGLSSPPSGDTAPTSSP